MDQSIQIRALFGEAGAEQATLDTVYGVLGD